MKKTKSVAAVSLVGLVAPMAAMAQNARVGAEQVSYLTGISGGLGALALGVAFFAGIVILIIACAFAFRDYVMETREKKFSIAQLIFGVAIGAMLVYPGAAFMLGQDLVTGDDAGVSVSGSDFKRENQD